MTKILAIDTSCDETAAAVVENTKILSNIIWSQASAHAKFGGVMPSLARRMHEERIDWVINKAIKKSGIKIKNIDAIAVTVGPGLSIALGVGIQKAKELAQKYNKRLVAVNHLEGHLLSSLAGSEISNFIFPGLGLVISGGNTVLVKINKIGSYETLAQTTDDALGEALDKGARMLGLGYPGGAILEKMAKFGDKSKFTLPVPIAGQEKRQMFTYSGLKTAMMREVGRVGNLSRQNICDLSASYQNVAFKHIERVLDYMLKTYNFRDTILLVGGGVSANTEIRKRLRNICKIYKVKTVFPHSKKLYGDNAAMIGVAAYLNQNFTTPEEIDRKPNLKLA
jgi:N6-L-threonylcarbamoyladenine synthase